jgi:DNA helicase-2/ATP-dependent DNA helicase PcrA
MREGPLSIEYRELLNPSQLEAVLHSETPLLVLAGAGSGKTRVITYKIAYLIHECGYRPEEIFAVTFTNKASNEMRERVNVLLEDTVDVWVRTFHSSAAKLLRMWGKSLGINPGFSIIDQQDQRSVLKKVIRNMNIDTETYRPEKYVYLINRAKDLLMNADEAASASFSSDLYFDDVYAQYQDLLDRENLFDFSDLLFRLTRALERHGEILERIRKRFRYILVDEFQDTNHAQYVLIRQLSKGGGNICVVGDDDQSIYGFRGARIENIHNFVKEYENCKVIKLEENYRSFQNILTASSQVINNNAERLGKTLYTKKGEGEKLIFCRTGTDYEESRFISKTILDLVLSRGYRYRDCAVFYRMNAQSRAFESVFNQDRIPYTIVGGLRFFAREEIKDVLGYIRLAMNPMDEIALRRIANRPPRGIGQRTVDAMVKARMDRGYSILHGDDDFIIAPSRKKLVLAFTELIADIGERITTQDPPSLLQHVYTISGYLEWLRREQKEDKVKNLEELYNAVYEFHRRSPESSIVDFIEEVSLNQGAREDEFQDNRVHLITLHNAKGLEFPVVFMAGMEEGVFPHYLSGEVLQDQQEERRLCYVGMTRAMERLYLTAAKNRLLWGRTVERDVSNFIREIPKDLFIEKEFGMSAANRAPQQSGGSRLVLPSGSSRKKRKIVERDNSNIMVNSRVVHESFGRGTVRSLQDDVAEIEFDDGLVMQFMLKYTPIQIENS